MKQEDEREGGGHQQARGIAEEGGLMRPGL